MIRNNSGPCEVKSSFTIERGRKYDICCVFATRCLNGLRRNRSKLSTGTKFGTLVLFDIPNSNLPGAKKNSMGSPISARGGGGPMKMQWITKYATEYELVKWHGRKCHQSTQNWSSIRFHYNFSSAFAELCPALYILAKETGIPAAARSDSHPARFDPIRPFRFMNLYNSETV